MKIAIIGAGALGVWFGGKLAAQGEDVSSLARGDTRVALQRHGWCFQEGGKWFQKPARVEDRVESIGLQDLVVISVKSTSLPSVIPLARALCHSDTSVLVAMNGVPWWFLESLDGSGSNPVVTGSTRLASLDRDGFLSGSLPLSRLIACVVHSVVSSAEPGVSIVHSPGRLILGELNGATTARLLSLQQAFTVAEFVVTISPQIQADIWNKLLANMIFNPLSALTRATTDVLIRDPLLRPIMTSVHGEAVAVAKGLGLAIEEDLEARLQMIQPLGRFRTSMLQDLEAGRHLEIDTLLRAPRELAQRLGIATPGIDTLLGCIQHLDRNNKDEP